MFHKTLEQINGNSIRNFYYFFRIDFIIDYVKTIGQMFVSILNNFAQKSIKLNERTLTR